MKAMIQFTLYVMGYLTIFKISTAPINSSSILENLMISGGVIRSIVAKLKKVKIRICLENGRL